MTTMEQTRPRTTMIRLPVEAAQEADAWRYHEALRTGQPAVSRQAVVARAVSEFVARNINSSDIDISETGDGDRD